MPVERPLSNSPPRSEEHAAESSGLSRANRRDFNAALAAAGLSPLRRDAVRTLQINVGKLCNQACHHCHVDAGPKRTETMERQTAERVVALLAASPGAATVDLTGGAPELNPHFPYLVESATNLGRHLIVRCNLTVLFEPRMEHLPDLYRRHAVELTCSLPCYTADNVDRQRGRGVFDRSIEALRILNRLGYGRPGSALRLNLVYNPLADSLPPPQPALEAKYRQELQQLFGIEFHRLFTITNMPIKRFAEQLHRSGHFDDYLGVLVNHFNPATVGQLMCRSLVSVDWQGRLYDCDFNQMLELPLPWRQPPPSTRACITPARHARGADGALRQGSGQAPPSTRRQSRARTIWEVECLDELAALPIATGEHCFGCTAGAGSSCAGALQ